MPGAEPFSAAGGPDAVLVLHGFTGNPSSVRGIAERLADAGFTVEAPLLPGHGTALTDLVSVGWSDWSGAAEDAYAELAARCAKVAVVGLSMGGGLTCRLAARHPEIAGIVLINPLVEPPADDFRAALQEMVREGATIAPSIGSDIARKDVAEITYDGTPLPAALSLFSGVEEVALGLSEIQCPVLLFSSRQDHVVPTTNGDLVASSVSGPCERVWLEHSFHVATLDNDRDELEARTVTFVTAVTAGADA